MLGSGSVQQLDMLARQLPRRAERRQSDDGRSFRPGAGATIQAGSCRVHHKAGAAHFDALMVEELPAQEDLCCNLHLLNEHQ